MFRGAARSWTNILWKIGAGIPAVYAVRMEDWKYMIYPDINAHAAPCMTLRDMGELHALKNDPNELRNLVGNSECKGLLDVPR